MPVANRGSGRYGRRTVYRRPVFRDLYETREPLLVLTSSVTATGALPTITVTAPQGSATGGVTLPTVAPAVKLDGVYIVNGRDVHEFGVRVFSLPDLYGRMIYTHAERRAVARAGASGGNPTSMSTRLGTVEAWVEASSYAELQEKLEHFDAFLRQGTLEIRTIYNPDRVYYGSLRENNLQPAIDDSAMGINYHGEGSFTVYHGSPNAYSRYPAWQAEVTAATRVMVDHGTFAAAPTLYVLGAATNPVLSFRDQMGVVRGSLTVPATTLTSDDALEIDLHTHDVFTWLNGVRSEAPSIVSPGLWPLLNPQYADPLDGVWMTIETSAGALAIETRRVYTA